MNEGFRRGCGSLVLKALGEGGGGAGGGGVQTIDK